MTHLKYRTVLLRCARLLSDEYNELLLSHQLNYSLWQVLYLIQQRPGINSNEIAQELNVSKPSITKRVHQLIQLNLIEALDPQDKRHKPLCLNAQGHQVYQQCSEIIDQHEQALLASFDATALKHSFETLKDLLEQLESRKHPTVLEATHE